MNIRRTVKIEAYNKQTNKISTFVVIVVVVLSVLFFLLLLLLRF